MTVNIIMIIVTMGTATTIERTKNKMGTFYIVILNILTKTNVPVNLTHPVI
jgi:hypothetical protein